MYEQLGEDIKAAMRAKEADKLAALRMLKSKLLENKTAAKPKAELDVAISYHKQVKDSAASFPEGSELRLKAEQELRFLEPYLPKQMTRDEVTSLVKEIIGAGENMNFGMVMKALSPQIKGRFDGKEASAIVKELM